MDLLIALLIGGLMFWLLRPGRASRSSIKVAAAPPPTPKTKARGQDQVPRLQPARAPAVNPSEPRMRIPITLGVAVLLQTLGLAFVCVIGALLYIRTQLGEREHLSSIERRLTEQLTQAKATAQSAGIDLESAKRALREQREELHRLQSKLMELEQTQSSLEAKVRTRAARKPR
jgi:hypothetical protein